jgi:hypothetical protein
MLVIVSSMLYNEFQRDSSATRLPAMEINHPGEACQLEDVGNFGTSHEAMWVVVPILGRMPADYSRAGKGGDWRDWTGLSSLSSCARELRLNNMFHEASF